MVLCILELYLVIVTALDNFASDDKVQIMNQSALFVLEFIVWDLLI
jgi:hypothetical protein